MIFLPVFLFCITALTQARVSYDNFKVLRVVPKTTEQLLALRDLENDSMGLNFWNGPSRVNRSVDIMVAPGTSEEIDEILSSLHLESQIYVDNVQKLIDNERPRTRAVDFGWTDYYELDQIYAFLQDLADTYPGVVEIVKGGESYEGRDILGVHVSYPGTTKSIFIEGGIHAREWISPATVTYLLNELVTSDNTTIREIAEAYDWYIFPVFNVDGYVYTFTTDRLWRKTRVPYFLCYGADPNRNWNFEWLNGGSSTLPCSQTFAGPTPFSEPSVRSLSEYIATIASTLEVYISFHSYSQLLMHPYGHTTEHIGNYDELYAIAGRAVQALASKYGTEYDYGNIGETIYIASGGSIDWVKGTFGTRVAYTYELRDQGTYGFVLPANQILPNCEEVLDSLVAMVQAVQELPPE